MPGEEWISHGGPKKSSKAQQPGGNCCSRRRSHDHRTRPSEQKPGRWINSPAQVNVITPSLGDGGTQLGIAERRKEYHNPANDPNCDDSFGRVQLASHITCD